MRCCAPSGRLRAQGIEATAQDLIAGRHREIVGAVTVCCATDGNHGRSVAWGAQMFGCRCRIYIHENVSRTARPPSPPIGRDHGAAAGRLRRSVRAAARDAEANGWHLVADTNAGGGLGRDPNLVMQGYTLIVDELSSRCRAAHPRLHPRRGGRPRRRHRGRWAKVAGAARPRMVVVEPQVADCVFRALRDGVPAPLEGDVNSFMACLSAGEVSPAAWPILQAVVDDAVAIPDGAAMDAMIGLARGRWGDARSSRASRAAPVAAVLAVATTRLRAALALDPSARPLHRQRGRHAPSSGPRHGLRPQDVSRGLNRGTP
jgi:diaminopropionate ammonia-lyase